MRILRVVYGIYTTCFDQSDFSIWYNYDLNHNMACFATTKFNLIIVHVCMATPYRTTKFPCRSANILLQLYICAGEWGGGGGGGGGGGVYKLLNHLLNLL